MMMRRTVIVMSMMLAAACGPDPDEIVKAENKKLTDLEPVEAAKVEEAMSRIRYESEIIAKGGVLPAEPDSVAEDTIPAAAAATSTPVAPAPAPKPKPVQTTAVEGNFPHHIQVGAFTTAEGAKAAVELWEKRGFANAIAMENPNATTVYKHVVRLTGYNGYSMALAESNRINTTYRVRTYPIQIAE
jgi:cell division septation protein DedD